jgi:hypothetical protein
MRPGRSPARRSRNIGTAKQGHGSDNKLVIPGSIHGPLKFFWESLSSYQAVSRLIGGKQFTILVEKTRKDTCHACTVDDIAFLLGDLPHEDLRHFDLIVLRQPKRKEEILSSVWGRAAFSVEIGKHCGPAVMLEANAISKPLRWSKSLRPDYQAELERLKQDGHEVKTARSSHVITLSLDAVRSTQLYRTLLHEIGHHIDYRRTGDEAWDRKTSLEKESFAHGYADSMRQKLISQRVVPFERILDVKSLKRDGLSVDDFTLA